MANPANSQAETQNQQQVTSTETQPVVQYDGSEDGWMNFLRLNGTKIPSGNRLWHTDRRAVAWMTLLGSKENLGKALPCLVFLNDMSVPQGRKNVSIEDRGFKNAENKEVKLTAKALGVIQAAIDEDYESWIDEQDPTPAEAKRILEFGTVLGYLNVFFYKVVDKEIILHRLPGSKGLRSKVSRDRSTYFQQRHIVDSKGNPLGEECTATFAWNDKARNTHVSDVLDLSGIVGL